MPSPRRNIVPAHLWNRLTSALTADAIAAGQADALAAGAPDATVDAYRTARTADHALAVEGAVRAQLADLVARLGDPDPTSELGALVATVAENTASAAGELAAGMPPGELAAVRQRAAAGAAELGAWLRREAFVMEALGLAMKLRADDLEADQRAADAENPPPPRRDT